MLYKDPHTFADLQQGQISHIDFNFYIDFNSKTIQCKNIYTFAKKITGSFFLDTRNIDIEKITYEKQEITWELDKDDKVLGQRLHLKNLEDARGVTIEYELSDKSTALQWLDPDQTAGKQHPYLFSQCQAIHGRSVFPCQDTPAVRFTYGAELNVPSPLSAVMSSARTDVYNNDGRNICTFRMPQPIPSYLFALAVGNLVDKDLGPRSRIYAEPEVIEKAAWEFAGTEVMIEEAEKLFGPYIWDRFDMLVMPPSFPYGGMENPRLTFLTPTIIVGDRSMANVVTHELAHSWTGNLVTNATWEDFWLNEGWTVYAERRILEAIEGIDYANLQGALRRNSMLNDMKLFGMGSKPTCLKFNQDGIDPDEVFSTIPYEKGFAFLNRIENEVGRDKFDPFIEAYIEKYKFKSINTEEFINFVKMHFPDIDSKIDIHNWIYEPGFPDDAIPIQSKMLDEVKKVAQDYEKSILPEASVVKNWKSEQLILLFQSIPRQIPIKDCEYFEKIMELNKTKNISLLSEFYQISIASGYQKVLQGVEDILSSVGRMLYLKSLYRSLIAAGWSREKARQIFEENKASYHPIAAAGIEAILDKAGL